jgi:hypothetical protein
MVKECGFQDDQNMMKIDLITIDLLETENNIMNMERICGDMIKTDLIVSEYIEIMKPTIIND